MNVKCSDEEESEFLNNRDKGVGGEGLNKGWGLRSALVMNTQ